MLLEFTVGNYLSFKDKKTLSLEATSIKDNPGNVIESGKYKLLRSAVIYGANSSGKSNFIKALAKMREMVKSSINDNSTSEINVTPFLLNIETENQPSYFEILFLIKDIRYRYGFEANKEKIVSEWLFENQGGRERNLFLRDSDKIEVNSRFPEGKGVEEKTRDNALFLSVVDQFNGTISKTIMSWFDKHMIFSGLQHEGRKILTSFFLKEKNLNAWVKDFLSPMRLGFDNFGFVNPEKEDGHIVTYHNKYDDLGNIVSKQEFKLLEQESSGTNKLYDMAGSIVFGLNLGGIVVIDELDAKLHPILTMAIVNLFNSPEQNKTNAQLIFTTHDTNLLNHECFRRDQIYFTEKNRVESTDLYSLVEYREKGGKKIRNDRSFEKDYISGRYGAIPYIGDFSKLSNNGKSREN